MQNKNKEQEKNYLEYVIETFKEIPIFLKKIAAFLIIVIIQVISTSLAIASGSLLSAIPLAIVIFLTYIFMFAYLRKQYQDKIS